MAVPHPVMFEDDDPMLLRLREITLSFPDAAEKVSHGRPAFYTTKVFAYFGGTEKVAGEYIRHDQAVMVLTDPAERPALLAEPHSYLPMYLGPSGWVGFDLDPGTDWTEIAELVDASYRLTAGVRRVQRLEEKQP